MSGFKSKARRALKGVAVYGKDRDILINYACGLFRKQRKSRRKRVRRKNFQQPIIVSTNRRNLHEQLGN